MKQLTRHEFHDLVWSKPMTELAKTFSLSDVALHKICKKHRIPTPGLGYWAKLVAGKPVTKSVFCEIDDEALNIIYFAIGWRSTLPPEVLETRAKAEATYQEHSAVPAADKLHPLVKHMQRKLAKARMQKQTCIKLHEPGFFSVTIAPASTDRLIHFLNQLVTEGEGRGYRFEAGEALQFRIDGEAVALHIVEKTDRLPHLLTDKEAAALQRWEVECANKRKRNQYIHEWENPKVPAFDDVFNGRLVIQLDKPGYHGDGLRRKFSDGHRHRLEERIQDVLITAATCAALIQSKRAADERREREWQEQERLVAIKRRQEKLEIKRTEHLEKNLGQWRHATEIRTFISKAEAVWLSARLGAEDQAKVEMWLAWARGYANQIDPLFKTSPILLQESDFHSWELG